MKKTESSESDNDLNIPRIKYVIGNKAPKLPHTPRKKRDPNKPKLPCPYCFSLNTSNNGTEKNLNDPRTYCNTCKWSYSTQIAENFAYAFQNKKGKINESVNLEIGVTKKTSDSDITKIVIFSPEEGFTNPNQSKLTKEQIALVISDESPFPITKYIFVYFTGIKRNRTRLYKLSLQSINRNVARYIINLDFIRESAIEVICKDKYKSKIVTLFEGLPATYLKNSPEINEQKHLDVSALKERMKKIYQRKENKNLRLKRFAVRLNKLDGEELLEFLMSANIMAKSIGSEEKLNPNKIKKNNVV
ncbi:hypothetical protein LUQ84_001158 [Hamiltosporidium tvaerminnensis]|nr:hypothetical protein LUQ84_001158 [Hamiltosporidium tvaerminnensis]